MKKDQLVTKALSILCLLAFVLAASAPAATPPADSEPPAATEPAATEPAAARRQQPSEPRDRMKAVGRIAERQIDRESQQQDERRGDGRAQDLGNESPASLATAATSTARATASARRS